jgi:hypothetical protein
MVVHACNPSTREAGMVSSGQLGLYEREKERERERERERRE